MRKILPFLSLLLASFILHTVLVLANTVPDSTNSALQVLELDAIDSGWYTNAGFHGPDNTNYVVGDCYLPQCSNLVTFRNFFVFDLSEVAGDIITASLLIENPAGGYDSTDPSETWTIFDVGTPVSTLVAGGNSLTGIYGDLGSGQMFGSAVVLPSSTLVSVSLNSIGLAALNARIGDQFAVGGAITTLDETPNSEWVFGNATEVHVRKLLLGMAGPLTMTINYPDGAPGSYFNVSGSGFPANQIGSITINSTELATTTVNAQGMFTFTLHTTNADLGRYFVTVSVNPSATITFDLSNGAPFRTQEGSYNVYQVPAGIALTEDVFLPTIIR